MSNPRTSVSNPPNVSIHDLDYDSLLSIFNLCRPDLFEKYEYGDILWVNWVHERWWYKLVKVCRRWRYLILGSASHLGLCLVYSRGTPVADMLAHSPPFPLIIFHDDNNHDLTPEDEGRIMFALEYRDRVRRIYLGMPVLGLQKIIKAMDDQFPMLEYLYIAPTTMRNVHLVLPATFRAPQLNHLMLDHFASPIGSPLLATAVSLVRLSLRWIHPSTNLYPDHLIQALSLLPQLQNLAVIFSSPVPKREIERHILRMPSITHTTLPNLRSFGFGGVNAYLEALLSNMNAPHLESLRVSFFHQLSFSVPHLRQFLKATRSLNFYSVQVLFYHKAVAVFMYPSVRTTLPAFDIRVGCEHLDWQVSSMAQIFNDLSPLFSAVVDLIIDYRSHTLSSEWHNRPNRTQWRKLLGSFRNVETLRVHHDLVGELTCSLRSDGEPPLEILPALKELVCPVGSRGDKTLVPFVHDRKVMGQPINLTEEDFPAGRFNYRFETLAGVVYVSADPDPLP